MAPEVDPDLATWLAAQTHTASEQVEAELEIGERRREFVADELIDAGFTGSELHDLVMRLTGLGAAAAQALVAARAELARKSAGEPVRQRDEHLAQNEILFRLVNERLAATNGAAARNELDVVCECTNRDCRRRMTLERAEYEWLRQHPLRFVVLPGHEAPAVEDVVERHPGYLIVEKHAETHRQVADADPRSPHHG